MLKLKKKKEDDKMYKVVKHSEMVASIARVADGTTAAIVNLESETITVDYGGTVVDYFELRALIDEILAGDYE